MVRDRPGAEERPAGSGTLLILLCSTGRDRACRRALGAPEPRARRPQSSRVGSSPTPCDGRSSPSTGIGTVGCSPPANHPTLLRRPHLLRRRRLRRRSTACSTSPYNPLAESRTRRADRNRSATVLSVYVDARPGRNIRFPKELAGLHPGGPNRLDVPLLDDVAEALSVTAAPIRSAKRRGKLYARRSGLPETGDQLRGHRQGCSDQPRVRAQALCRVRQVGVKRYPCSPVIQAP
jgi:hypothetical protein